MIDVSKARWELSAAENFAVNWFESHGFDGAIVKQWQSKTIFEISKNCIKDIFTLTAATQSKNINMAAYMEQYGKSFEMLRLLTKR